MATADQAGGGDGFFEFAMARACRASRRASAHAPRLLILAALCCAMMVAGCAPAAQRLSGASRIHTAVPRIHTAAPARVRNARPAARRAAPKVRPIDQTLLRPQAAPDCDYKEPEAETADPNVWARLKLDYERQCYRKAEMAARERLELVQTSLRKCGARPACAAGPSERRSAGRR